MPDLALDLRYLRYAMLVAELGSFRRAADVLNLSQSTVSRRIQLLERRLGVPLFERSRSGTRLTYAGERFIRDAAVGAGHLHQAASDLTLAQRGHLGELRIGLMASLASGFLADLLYCFRTRFPNVDVKLEEASSQSNAAGVLSGRLDAAFISGSPQLPECHTRELWDEGILVALPSQHALAARANVKWDEVRDETFLVSADGPGPEIEDYLVRQLSVLGFRPKILAQKLGRENLLNMVAKGFGLTLTTHSTTGTSYAGVAFVPIGDAEECVASSVVWPTSSQNPALKKLLELCDALVAKRDRRSAGGNASIGPSERGRQSGDRRST
jgi:DNA-binding transcriptional LysR family regulator